MTREEIRRRRQRTQERSDADLATMIDRFVKGRTSPVVRVSRDKRRGHTVGKGKGALPMLYISTGRHTTPRLPDGWD